MTELEWHQQFIDWLGHNGIITEKHIEEYSKHQDIARKRKQAKDFVDEEFKGLF